MKRFLLLLVLVFALSACNKNHEIVLSSTQDLYEFNLDSFNLRNIEFKAMIKKTEELIELDGAMLNDDDLNKLSQIGNHSILVNYKGASLIINVCLYKESYIVKYEYDNGLEDKVITVLRGDSLVEDVPFKDNHTFLGWHSEDLLWSFNTDKVLKDICLKAKWEVTKKNIKYYNNDILVNEENVQYGARVPDYVIATNQTDIFVGWKNKAGEIVQYVYSDTALYAQVYPLKEEPFIYAILDNEIYITGLKNKTITTIVIPEKIYGLDVTVIKDYAFYDCSSLESITLPNTIRKIGRSAFYGCVALDMINIPSNAMVDEQAFLETKLANDSKLLIINNVVLSYSGLEEIVTIPDGVTKIAPRAFYRTKIIKLNLPNSLKEIGSYAFGFSNLIQIEIPSSVNVFGENVFADTPWLKAQEDSLIINNVFVLYQGNAKEYSVPLGVKSIAARAFYDNNSLSKVIIPASVNYIAYEAFNSDINEIEFLGMLPEFDSSFVLGATIIRVKIEQEISSKYYRYYLVLHNTTYFEDYEYRETINGIIITRYLGSEKQVVIPDEILGKKIIALGAFSFFDSLVEEVRLPLYLKVIYPYAFFNSSSLNKIDFNNNLEHLSYYVFANCNKLKNLSLPNSLSKIDVFAFGSFSLENLTIDNDYYKTVDNVLYTKDLKTILFYPNGKKDTAYTILESVFRIEYGAFIMAQNIKVISFEAPFLPLISELVLYPEMVAKVEDPLYNKYKIMYGLLTNEVYKDSDFVGDFCIVNNVLVKYIGNQEEVVIPDGVAVIEAASFQGYGNPKRVIINHSLLIKTYALTYMRDLESVTINAECYISDYAFPITTVILVEASSIVSYRAMINQIEEYVVISKDSLVLENADYRYAVYNNKAVILKYLGSSYEVLIPDNINGNAVTWINNNAFVNSPAKLVDLPSSINKMGSWVFASSDVETVILRSTLVPSIKDSTFSYDEKIQIYVIKEKLNDYMENSFFSQHFLYAYDEYISEEGKFKYIIYDNQVIIKGHTGRQYEIIVPKEIAGYQVTSIASEAFKNNIELKNIILPKTVKKIGDNAFLGCVNLEQVKVYSETLINIGYINLSQLKDNFEFNVLANVYQDFLNKYEDLKENVSRFGILLTFHSRGGSSVKAVTILDTVVLPTKPYKLGYEFLGWGDFNGVSVALDTIETDTTLFALWEVKDDNYTVSFVTNSEALIDPIEKIYNDVIDMIIMPYKEEFHLEGWYLDAALTEKITFPYPVVSDSTLHAKWVRVVRDGSTMENALLMYKGINTINSNLIKTYYAFYPLEAPYQDRVYIFRSLSTVNVIIYLYDIYGRELKFNYGDENPFYLDHLMKQQYIYYIAFEKLDSSVGTYQVEVD